MPEGSRSISVELQADGVLWLVNRVVFHPRGFALGVDADGALSLQGDGSEVWGFEDRTDDECFAKVEALLRRARLANRVAEPSCDWCDVRGHTINNCPAWAPPECPGCGADLDDTTAQHHPYCQDGDPALRRSPDTEGAP